MSQLATYLHLEPEAALPEIIHLAPFRMVVIVETDVSSDWQYKVSKWIVESGCLYMMAWGKDCSSWDDTVDIANIEALKFGAIPEDRFVITTWHADEPLSEAFWYSKNSAFHPKVVLNNTILLHISSVNKELEFLKLYADA